MVQRASSLVFFVWLCFLGRAGFHAVLLPLWEGFDEWAHVAYIQSLAAGSTLPVPGQTRVSEEVQASLSLTPLPPVPLSTPHYTHDDYWKLPPQERTELRRQLEALPRSWALEETAKGERNYEAQQPPFYYLTLVPVQWAAGGVPLRTRVLLMRLVSLVAASLVIPLTYMVLCRATGSSPIAIAGSALLAAMPGPIAAAARVGNEGLAAVMFAALLWLALGMDQRTSVKRAVAMGTLLGAGLLTKAYFLTALPALAAMYSWQFVRKKGERRGVVAEAAVAYGIAGAMSVWWYWRNRRLTGSWSGLQQLAALPHAGAVDFARQALRTDWRRFLDISFNTHIWVGNWSFLQVRGWMYEVFAALALVAALGVVVALVRGRSEGATGSRFPAVAAGSFCTFFLAGLAYQELTFSFLNASSSAGWYLNAVVCAEVLLLALGWMALCPAAWLPCMFGSVTATFTALDLYTTQFVLAPYYAGLIAHGPSGRLASFHMAQMAGGGLAVMLGRVSGGILAEPLVAALWIVYLAASIALPLAAAGALRHIRHPD